MSKVIYSETANALNSLHEIMLLVHHVELSARMTRAANERRMRARGFRHGHYEWLNHASCGVQDAWGDRMEHEERKYQTLKSAVRLRDALNTGSFKKLERVTVLMDLVKLIAEQKESKV